MILKKLSIENLRSYEAQVIEFPKGSTLLSGDIGSGKTTILLAIEFALFGLQPSQKANSLLKNDKDSAKVKLEFEINSKNIIIERTLKRSKKSVSQDYSSISIDNEKFEGSVTEIKSKILNLLNYPKEFAKKTNLLYKFTVYTPQEEMKQIILESGDVRLNTLRHVFGIDKYKRIQENTSILTLKLREKIRINQVLVKDLEDIKEKLNEKNKNLVEQIKSYTKAEQEHQIAGDIIKQKEKALEEVQEKINEKRSLETEKSKSEVLVLEKNQQITTHTNTINNLKEQIQEAEKLKFNQEEYDSLNQRIKFQEDKEKQTNDEYMDIMSKFKSLESKKLELDSLKNKIFKLEKCPTCLQEVSEQYKNNMSTNADNELNQIQKILLELTTKKSELITQIELIKKAKQEFSNKKSELEILKIKLESLKEKQQRIYETEQQMQTLNKDLKLLNKHISDIEKSTKDYEKYEIIFEKRNNELIQSKKQENQLAIKKAENNKEIQFLEQQIKETQETIDKKQELKTQTEKIKELEFWITNKFLEIVLFTEKQVMMTLKDEFSKLFSKWFSILVSDSLNAKLGDDFSPIIEQQDYEIDYAFLSGGERTAIALAYRLSLNQVINSLLSNIRTSNLVILDEPTDGFSSQQLDKMRDVLNQLEIEQLILVSHEQKIEDFVDNIIRIKKENGLSRVES
ncbi:MAG: AAA family ATPase [archaeon]